MDSSYVTRVLSEILVSDEVRDFKVEEAEFRDWRGTIEVEVRSLDLFLTLVSDRRSRGWTDSVYHDAHRLLVGASFDASGDDFDGLRIIVYLDDLFGWANRYFGQERRPVPELVEAVNAVVHGSGGVEDRLRGAKKAEAGWLASRPARA